MFSKIGLKEIPLYSLNFLRFAIAAISILPFFLKNKPKLQNDFYKVILLSFLMCVNVIFFQYGVRLTTATIGQTLYIFVPIITAILSYMMLSESFTNKKIIGIFLGFAGAIIIILLPAIDRGSPFSGDLFGNILIGVGVLITAIYTVMSKSFQKKYTPLQLTAYFIFTSCFVFFFLALTDFSTYPVWWEDVSTLVIFSIFWLGLLTTTVYYLATQYAIKHGSPLIASMILYLQPVSAFLLASFLLGEQLTTGLIIGAILACIGVYLTVYAKK